MERSNDKDHCEKWNSDDTKSSKELMEIDEGFRELRSFENVDSRDGPKDEDYVEFMDIDDSGIGASLECVPEESATANAQLPLNIAEYRRRPVYLNPDPEFRQDLHEYPLEFVELQLAQLTEDLQNPEAAVEDELDSQNTVCLLCRTNKATRVVVPCGHRAGCVDCCRNILKHSVVEYLDDFLFVQTYSAPVRCPQCRCLVGKFMRLYS